MAPIRPSVSHSGQISLDLARGQEFDLDAPDRRGDAGIIFVLVEAIPRASEADVGDLAQADVEPGLSAERLVESDRIFVDLPDRVGKVEQRQQAGGVPGRAGGQFLALDQNAIAPALLGQMIERGYADNASADHDRSCMRAHGPPK